jgi:hypothetical protein
MIQNHDRPAGNDQPDPRKIRIIALYGTQWRLRGGQTVRWSPAETLGTDDGADLPTVIGKAKQGETVGFRPTHWRTGSINEARMYLLSVPSRRVIVGLQLEVTGWLIDTVELLRDCFHLDLEVAREPAGSRYGDLGSVAADAARGLQVEVTDTGFAAERYLLVSARAMHLRDPAGTLRRLIDWAPRADPPWPTPILYPDELNHPPGAAAMGAHVSVLCDQDERLVGSASVIACQAVASMTRLREIREGLSAGNADDLNDLEGVAGSPLGIVLRRLPPGANAFRRAACESIGITHRAASVRRQLRRHQMATGAVQHAIPEAADVNTDGKGRAGLLARIVEICRRILRLERRPR